MIKKASPYLFSQLTSSRNQVAQVGLNVARTTFNGHKKTVSMAVGSILIGQGAYQMH